MAAVLGSPSRSDEVENLIDFGVIPPAAQESTSDRVEEPTTDLEEPRAANPLSDVRPPSELRLQADRQIYDAKRKLFMAEGNVSAVLNGGVLQADRLEFDTNFNSLLARGSVRYRKGSQYFQASSLRFSLIQGSGSMDDVYGVLDLDTAAVDFNPLPGNQAGPTANTQQSEQDVTELPSRDKLLPVIESTGFGFPTAIDIELGAFTANRIRPQGEDPGFWDLEQPLPTDEWLAKAPGKPDRELDEGMACPPAIPPIPDWHPHPWAITAWGGQMIDSNFGDTFLFNGRMRPEYLLGVSMQKRIWKAGPLELELEADLFAHQAYEQQGLSLIHI